MTGDRLHFALSAVALATVVAGCADDIAAGIRLDECFADDQCERGFVCNPDFICVARDPGSLAGFAVEIVPPLGVGYVRAHFLEQAFSADNVVTFGLPEPRVFAYSVRDGAGDLIEARVTVVGKERIAGRATDLSETYRPQQPATLSLADGIYAVQVVPVSEAEPGVDIPRFEVRPTTAEKDFELPATTTLLRGVVHQRTDSNARLSGVEVRAVARPSGLPSSVARTGADGTFTLRLPQTQDTSYVVTARTFSGEIAWGYERTIFVDPEDQRVLSIGLENRDPDQIGAAELQVIGRSDGKPTPVAGAKVTLTASTARASQSLVIVGVTDAQGRLRAGTSTTPPLVIAAHYTAEIVPPSGSAFARTSTTIDLSRAGARAISRQLTIERRILVQGSVASASGQRVDGAILNIADTADQRLYSATTDGNGLFEVRLDPGDYAVWIVPSGATVTGEALPVGFATLSIPRERATFSSAPFVLPAGTVVRGVVLGSAGEPIERAEVEIFDDLAGRPTSIGRTMTVRDGSFNVVVPVR